LDKIPEHLPTWNWRILEFWGKFLEFFLEKLEFLSQIIQPLEFKVNIQSKTSILCQSYYIALYLWEKYTYMLFSSF